MNNHPSSSTFSYRPRWITPELQTAVEDYPALILSGARQVGKSTLLRHAEPFASWRYLTMDDPDVLRQAERNPAALWAGTPNVVLDEVQKVPSVLSAVKQTIDQDRTSHRFVLSGFANLLLMQQTSETLAGRALYASLHPMTLGERINGTPPAWLFDLFAGQLPAASGAGISSSELASWLIRGFLPPLLSISRLSTVVQWWESYVMTYLERDLRHLSQIESLSDFHSVMTALALRNGQMLNQTDLSRDVRVSQPTVHRYLNLLEATCLFERLPAFAKNRTTRLIKTPKSYFMDPGLAAYLAGHHTPESLTASREMGGIFETLILLHLRVLSQLTIPRFRLYYWRTTTGHEVDFILEQGRALIAIEAKLTSAPRYGDADPLRRFMADYPETGAGLLVHTGVETTWLDERILAVPWTLLAGAPASG